MKLSFYISFVYLILYIVRLVDEVVEVSEDQAVIAFIKCLEYTHTLTNGKGSIALAGLFSGKIQLRKDESVAVLIMGTSTTSSTGFYVHVRN